MELNKETIKKICGIITFTVILFLGLNNITQLGGFFGKILLLFSPFLIGACIAFILNVPLRFIERRLIQFRKVRILKKFQRPVSLILTLAFVFGLVFIVMFLIIPELANTISLLVKNIPGFVKDMQSWLEELVIKWPQIADWIENVEVDGEEMGQKLMALVQNGAGGFFNSTFGVVSSIVSGVVNFIIGFVFAIYLLFQKEKVGAQIRKILYSFFPEKRTDRMIRIGYLADKTFSNFLSGQCLEAVILGTMFFITMNILKMPYALLIGVLIAFMALIPIFGAFIGCIIGAFLILMVNPVQALWFVVMFIVIQQIEGNFIYPHVVGNSVGLPSMWVLVAVTLGGSTLGVAGMLINIPIFSIIYVLLRETVYKRLKEKKIPKEKWE